MCIDQREAQELKSNQQYSPHTLAYTSAFVFHIIFLRNLTILGHKTSVTVSLNIRSSFVFVLALFFH